MHYIMMIRKFRHRGLERFFTKGDHAGIPAARVDRIARILDRLDAAVAPADLNLPGYRWHALKGGRRGDYAVAVSGNWRVTFRFDGEDAVDVDLEDYH
jgi:proteic killer suppression protein